MNVRFSDSEVTPHQAVLANRVEQVLANATQYERREEPSQGNGPSVNFDLCTSLPHLSVRIIVCQDSIFVYANEAHAMIELVDDFADWVEGVVFVVTALIGAPLRIRVRKSLILRRPTGAIYLEFPNGRGWNGDFPSCRGVGKAATFENWCVPIDLGSRPEPTSGKRG